MNAPSNGTLLTFTVGERHYGLKASIVREVARMPRVSRVPHAPDALLGLANVRGAVVPVLSLARLLGAEDAAMTRIVVVEAGEPIALAVSGVSEMVQAAAERSVREIDIVDLVARSLPAIGYRRGRGAGTIALPQQSAPPDERIAFIAFSVAAQEFALPLAAVDEVLALPADVAILPHADEVVVGSAVVRGAVLPLVSLAALLKLSGAGVNERSRVVVARIGSHRVGLVVDAMRSILRVAEEAIDPIPQVLSRGGGEARIQAICRQDDGSRLVSILAADQIFHDDVTARLLQGSSEGTETMAQDPAKAAGDQFLLLRIGDEEFALPIGTVDEIAPLPPKLMRLPKAPAFVAGMINLRGDVIPVIDQAQRFDSRPAAHGKRRIVVLRMGDLRAGFIVDDITEVARIDPAWISEAPDLGGTVAGDDDVRVFERVASFPGRQRIVLIISPRELLSRAERDILGSLGKKSAAKQS